MTEYRHIANLAGPPGPPGIGSRGSITSPTDLDDMRTLSDVGYYYIRDENMINGPALEGNNPLARLDVTQGSLNGYTQEVTTGSERWWRSGRTNTEWWPWRRYSVRDHGSRSAPIDLDDYEPTDTVETCEIRHANITNGPPLSGDPVVTLEIMQGSLNGELQRATTREEAWWRKKLTNTEWGPWLRVVSSSDLDTFTGAGIDYDDDGVPYIADGSGDNPQPASRRLVTEQSLPSLTTTSPTVRRIITSTNPDEPLDDGDLLLVYESE